MSTEEKKKFLDFVQFTFDKDRIFDFISDRASPDDSRKNIRDVVVEYAFETGEEKGLLHAHILVSVKHQGFLTLRVNDIRALARKIFGHNLYISAPVTSDSTSSWLAYINKKKKMNTVVL